MKLLRTIRAILVFGLLAGGCSLTGIGQLHDWFTYEDPVPVTCAQGLEDKTWVELSGCEALLADATVHQATKLKIVTSITVPIRAAGSDIEPNVTLQTSDKVVIDAAKEALQRLEANDPKFMTPAEKKTALPGLIAALRPPSPHFKGA